MIFMLNIHRIISSFFFILLLLLILQLRLFFSLFVIFNLFGNAKKMDIFLFCSTKKLNKTEIINLNIEQQHQKTKNKNTFE